MTDVYDALVVGSGFGGAVAADRLTRAGWRVGLVERGPWRDTAPVRKLGIRQRAPLPYGWRVYSHFLRNIELASGGRAMVLNQDGLFEVFVNADVSILCSSGVGGGSHVYTALNVRPSVEGFWDDCHDAVSPAALEPHYVRVIAEMGGRHPRVADRIPNLASEQWRDSDVLDGTPTVEGPLHAVTFAAGNTKRDWSDGGVLGSPQGTKRTLDEVYLGAAVRRGLHLFDLHEALGVFRLDGAHRARWRVEVYDHRAGRHRSLRADRVLLAAGTLNTLRLLLRSRDELGGVADMPGLGARFGTNGDWFSLWPLDARGADFTRGLPAQVVRLRRPGRGGVPPYLLQVGFVGSSKLALPAPLRQWCKQNLVLFAMGSDAADGTVTMEGGALRVRYDTRRSLIFARIRRTLAIIGRGTGVVPRSLPSPWTVHPLGGAVVGQDARRGVVDHRGEVYGNPGLHVVDAAALPRSPGAPPSMSIAAWSSWVAAQLAAQG